MSDDWQGDRRAALNRFEMAVRAHERADNDDVSRPAPDVKAAEREVEEARAELCRALDIDPDL